MRSPGLLYTDDLVLFFASEESLRVVVGHYVEICERIGV